GALEEANPDVLVIIGDDQEELFKPDNRPVFAVYTGDSIHTDKPADMATQPKGIQASYWGQYPEEPTSYPAEPDLAKHLIDCLIADEFDVAYSASQPGGGLMSHAFTFVHRRLMKSRMIPTVPVWINTYYPPNQPRSRRCLEF